LRPGTRRACGIGSKGFRVYDWALVDTADPDHKFLFRRSIDDGELAYYRCYNPNHAPVGTLVHVAGARWPIEECFGSSKNETALDHYQVRTWDAWHRHITLAMLAHTYRNLIPLTLAEIRRLLALARRGKEAITHGLHWSTWRRDHQAGARRAHFRKRLKRQVLPI
jgi:hypothetical protein